MNPRPALPRRFPIAAAAVAVILAACGGGSTGSSAAGKGAAGAVARERVLAKAVLGTHAAQAAAGYAQAVDGAVALDAAVRTLAATPTAATLATARTAWLDSRPAYLQTERFRFSGGPIDGKIGDADGPEPRINAWPLDEAYIDYVEGDAGAGIINKPAQFPTITRDLIAHENERGGEENISSGYHAVEFLLWGQDRSATGPGDRPIDDYVPGRGTNVERRTTYLLAVSAMLVDDLRTVAAQWAPGGAYRATFTALDPAEGLTHLLTGMGTLSGGELTGQRISVAYDSKDKEDEHSCFSDNTHADHVEDEGGIRAEYLGIDRAGASLGPSLSDLVRRLDPALDARVRGQLDAGVAAIAAVPTPFDQAILGDDSAPGRQAIRAAISTLQAQTKGLVAVADQLGLTINTTA